MGGGGPTAREFSRRGSDGHTSGPVDMYRPRNAPQAEHNGKCAQHAEANDSPDNNQDDFQSSAGWRGNGRGWCKGNLPSGNGADGWQRRKSGGRATTLAKSCVRRQLSPALRTKTSHGSSSRNWRLYITLIREEPAIRPKSARNGQRNGYARNDRGQR